MRRRSHALEGPARAHGPYRAGFAGGSHLVPQVLAEPHRSFARHDAEGPRADSLLRILCGDRAGSDAAQAASAPQRGRVRHRPGRVRRRRLHRLDRRRGAAGAALGPRSRTGEGDLPRGAARHQLGGQAQEAGEAPEADRSLHGEPVAPGMDDPRGHSGDPARAAAAGAARWRPFRHLRPQRPLPPGDQPQQPLEKADRTQGSRHHRPQREAHVAGGGRRPLRQRPPRPGHHRRQQAAAEVALRHAQGQAGPLPPEPARQARRLLGPLGDRGRSRTQAAPVRPAQEDGPRAVQALHLRQARTLRHGLDDQGREKDGRKGTAGSLGHSGRSHPRASGDAEPGADPCIVLAFRLSSRC